MSRTAARRLLLGLALAAAGYLLAANLFLNTPLGEWAVNRRPERVRLAWDSAWSLWPGHVAMRGLEVGGRQRRVQWWVGVESGRARLDLPRLLRRELRLAGVRAEGVRSRTVWRRDDGKPSPPRRPGRRRPWRVTLDGIEIAGLRELRAGPLRIEGNGSAAGSLRFVAGRQVEARLERLALRGGPLRA
ncbi:MAG TPA: hypothetical protein VF121_09075, partial [Thermoanaerobaculia bacterium]|nr:hypothetical protein [Thermoanaerobaculia bacterium]